eukprot:62851-Lingulodinium_polyedra.AAC.1
MAVGSTAAVASGSEQEPSSGQRAAVATRRPGVAANPVDDAVQALAVLMPDGVREQLRRGLGRRGVACGR